MMETCLRDSSGDNNFHVTDFGGSPGGHVDERFVDPKIQENTGGKL